MDDIFGVNVTITAVLPDGTLVYGTVLVNVNGDCDLGDLLDRAMAWVDAGGWGTGGRGTGPATAQIGQVRAIIDGGYANPSLSYGC